VASVPVVDSRTWIPLVGSEPAAYLVKAYCTYISAESPNCLHLAACRPNASVDSLFIQVKLPNGDIEVGVLIDDAVTKYLVCRHEVWFKRVG